MAVSLLHMTNVFLGDTLSFIGDQTSYMSICVGEGQDDSLSLLSPQDLRQKVKNAFRVILSNAYSLAF